MLGIVRVIFGNAVGMSFRAAEYYDDALLINYALRTHYTMPDVYSLAKNMSFPWFIDLCYVLHINLAVGISLLWVVAALAAYAAARILTNGNVWIAGFVYVYVLFYPSAFEWWCGTRIYRNSILAPSYILVFSLAIAVLVMIFCNVSRNVAIIVTSVLLGFALSFTYYISENGSWLTYSLGAAGVLAVFSPSATSCVGRILTKRGTLPRQPQGLLPRFWQYVFLSLRSLSQLLHTKRSITGILVSRRLIPVLVARREDSSIVCIELIHRGEQMRFGLPMMQYIKPSLLLQRFAHIRNCATGCSTLLGRQHLRSRTGRLRVVTIILGA